MSLFNERLRRRSFTVAGLSLAAVCVLSVGQADASYNAQLRGQTLQVTGNKDADNLVIALSDPNTLSLDVGADGTADFSFPRSAFNAINVEAGGGDDQVTVSRNGGSFPEKAITIDGGSGDDTLIGSDGNETFEGGPGNDFIDGNIGADAEFGGTGSDTFQWDPGDGSDTLEGEGGKDTMQFNGSNAAEKIDISSNGGRVRFHRDVANITMDLATIERINFRALGSADTVTVGNLSDTDVDLTDVDLGSFDGTPDGAADNVIVDGTDGPDKVSTSSPMPGQGVISGLGPKVQVENADLGTDHITAATLGGADTLTTDVGVSGPVVGFDGGADSDTARYNGSDYADTIGIANNGTFVRTFAPGAAGLDTTAVENLDVEGLGGDDTIEGQNGIATLTDLTIGGGDGDDTIGGGDGDDTLNGGNGDDHVDGNRGNDTAKLGNGDDHFQWDPGDGSDSVDGQSGSDALDFNGSNAAEKIDLSANGSRSRLVRDVAAITMDFDTIEAVNVRTLGSADTVTVNDLTGTGIRTADVNLAAFDGTGDGAADTVIENGSNRRETLDVSRDGNTVVTDGLPAQLRIDGSESLNDTLRVNTLGGKDAVTVEPGVTDLINPLVDLGVDQ